MLPKPFYDPAKSYDENYAEGPFGVFVDGEVYEEKGEPKFEFLGHKVYLPFGIGAGPLLNSAFMRGAFDKGFDLAVYKTVRSSSHPCHPFPNVLAVHPEGNLTLEMAKVKPLIADTDYTSPISITNSFGVPSKEPSVWQEDFRKAKTYERKGQLAILSFMGTAWEGQGRDAFIDDYVLTAKLAAETGAKVLEVNLSCPNIGDTGLVCYDLDMAEKICERIRNVIGLTPLILKVGYYADDGQLKNLVEIAGQYAQAIASINTIQAAIIDEKGNQALPGATRMKSGVCGASIMWAGLDMTRRLALLRAERGMNFEIVGVGGVMKLADYVKYREAGADAVMSATGAMWDGNLAAAIKGVAYNPT